MSDHDAPRPSPATRAAPQQLMIMHLKDVVRTLVKFAVHDPICDKLKPDMESHLLVDRRRECTCGLQKLYDRIDSLIED